MREVVAALAFLVLLLGAKPGAALDSQSHSVAIRGEAQPVCSFSSPQALQAANMAIAPSALSQNTIGIGTLIDPATAKLAGASIWLSLKGLCNRAHSISISTGNGGLKPANASPGAPAPGFSSRVDYTAQVVWASSTSALRTAGTSGQATPAALTNGAYSGDLGLQIVIDPAVPGDLPMLAGTYTDKITVTFRPQF